MKQNFCLAKPYDLANQKLPYIPIYKPWRKRQRLFLRTVGEYGPSSRLLEYDLYMATYEYMFRLFTKQNICI